MSHYEEIRIGAFRGLQDLTLSGCGPVNLLVGENNSGKTSVLEALVLLSDPTDPAQWEAAVELRQTWPLVDMRFRLERVDRLDSISWLFPRKEGKQFPIQIETKGGTPVSSMVAYADRIEGTPPERPIVSSSEIVEGGRPSFYDSRAAAEMLPVPGISIEMDLKWDRALIERTGADPSFRMILWERGRVARVRPSTQRAKGAVAFATPISHRSDGYLASRFGRLVRTKRTSQAVELLQVLDSRILSLQLISPEEPEDSGAKLPMRSRPAILHVEHSEAGLIPLYALGDGTRRAVHFAVLLAELGQGGILLIDEIEAGMHTSVLQEVFRWLGEACRSSDVQLFATTHSLEAVDSILEAVPDHDLVLYRLRNGEARRYDGRMLRTARVELGQEVR